MNYDTPRWVCQVTRPQPIAKRRKNMAQPDQCTVETCERPARRYGFCETHSGRFAKFGDPLADVPIVPVKRYDPICSIVGCNKSHDMLGFCNMHAQRFIKEGDPGEVASRHIYKDGSPCLVDGCKRLVHTRGYCEPHYRRWYRHGDPLGGNPIRTPRPLVAETPDGHKWCSRCELIKPLSGNFGYDKRTKDGWAHWCKRCYTDRHLMKTYNITLEQYELILANQGGGCALCGIELDPNSRVSRLSVDHDHACCSGPISCGDCVRGLLCSSCNHTLGMARDDVALLSRMIDYLQLHSNRREQGYGRGNISYSYSD